MRQTYTGKDGEHTCADFVARLCTYCNKGQPTAVKKQALSLIQDIQIPLSQDALMQGLLSVMTQHPNLSQANLLQRLTFIKGWIRCRGGKSGQGGVCLSRKWTTHDLAAIEGFEQELSCTQNMAGTP